MDTQIIKMKFNTFHLTEEPFIELDRCFEPCIGKLKQQDVNESEKACYTNCVSKYLMATHNLKMSVLMLSRNLQTAATMRSTVEKEINAANEAKETKSEDGNKKTNANETGIEMTDDTEE